jgi:hypothetical protein
MSNVFLVEGAYTPVTSPWQLKSRMFSFFAKLLASTLETLHVVAYRPVANQWRCKQWPLLGNAHRNRTTGLCNSFLSNGSINTHTTIGVLLKTMFSIRSVRSGFEEEFSWESAIEFRSSRWAVSRELSSAGSMRRWRYAINSGVKC